jgi:hypothetical protein
VVKRFKLKASVVRDRMAQLGLTNADVAKACDIDVRTVQRWFGGQSVKSSDAERVAELLNMGTADVFSGVAELSSFKRIMQLQGLLSSHDNAVSQAARLATEAFGNVWDHVHYESHPVHGYLSRHAIAKEQQHRYLAFDFHASSERADVDVRVRMGRRFAYSAARIYLRSSTVYAVGVTATNSMIAARKPDGHFTVWIWIGPEAREVMFVCDHDMTVTRSTLPSASTLQLADPGMEHAVCIRPGQRQLVVAALPLGFDRLVGPREGRVDVPIDLDEIRNARPPTAG